MHPINSDTLNKEEIDEFLNIFPFTENEIRSYFDRFRFLDRTESGFISYSDLLLLPEYVANPFNHLIMETIEEIFGSSFTFLVFLQIMDLFSNRMKRDERINFYFALLNRNKTNRITKSIIFKFFKKMNGEKFNKKSTIKFISALFSKYDKTGRGFLDKHDIEIIYKEHNIDAIFYMGI